MDFDADVLRRLHDSPQIFRRIADSNAEEFALQQELRKEFPDHMVRTALSLAELRRRARGKFTRADEMWFDRTALEQSTAELVARHKSARFGGRVWDYCCGIGSDSIALAEHCEVIAIDRDPAACVCCGWNAEVYGVGGNLQVRCADVETITDRWGLVHIDPDRRAGTLGHGAHPPRRSLKIEEGSPGLPFLSGLTEHFRGGAIKLSPASNFGGKFPTAEVELVSLNGECKEATIWFGELAQPATWRATVLPLGETLTGDPYSEGAAVSPLGRFVFDPDPAVVRAGLVDVLAAREGLNRLDDEEEYLTGGEAVPSPFLRSFEVLAELPNNDREIRDYFRGSCVGPLEIKCRRIPIDAAAVRRKLTLKGDEPAVLIFARIAGRARAIVARRLGRGNSAAR